MANTTYERVGAAAVLTITRRERRNAVDADTAAELLDAHRRFESDDAARVLVLTGEGPEAFCAGADLKAVAERGAAFDGDDPQAAVDEWLDTVPDGPMGFTRLSSTKPTIAAVSGWCLAGGLELALWCDLRIGTPNSRFGYPERRWGVPLIDGGTQRLPLVVGMGRALELILTGRIIDAAEAHTWGLVNEVVDEGAHLTRALEIAEALASFPQPTMLSDRIASIEGAGLSLDDGLALEERLGRQSVITGVLGAARFAEGEGRGGEGAGA
jgi:enoyl-CoA hydratase/carnithine racemase